MCFVVRSQFQHCDLRVAEFTTGGWWQEVLSTFKDFFNRDDLSLALRRSREMQSCVAAGNIR